MRLLAQHDHSALVAFGGDGDKTAADLLRDAGAVARALPAASPGSKVLIVCKSDRYLAAVAILGALEAGHDPLLPLSNDGEVVTGLLARADVVGLLHDTRAGQGLRLQAVLAAAAETSGGALVEAPRLPEAWRPSEATAAVSLADRVVCTMPPVGAWGRSLGLILPLLTGRAFSRSMTLDGAGAVPGATLVSVPAHLRRLRALAPGGLARLAGVVSVGAPLPDGLRGWLSEAVGGPVSDLFEPSESPAARVLAGLLADPDVADAAARQVGETVYAVAVGSGGSSDAGGSSAAVQTAAPATRLALARRIVRDESGEANPVMLMRHFGRDPNGRALSFELGFGVAEEGAGGDGESCALAVSVPHDYAHYQGHFAGYPIMAGVVQLHELVVPACRAQWPGLGTLRRVLRIKFNGRIEPGNTVSLALRRGAADGDEETLWFELTRGGKTCASGRLVFALASA